MLWAEEESFIIYSGSEVVYASPIFEMDSEREIELCLNASPNLQYTLVLYDDASDSWSSGSWLSFEGINGNLMFKQFMVENSEESFPLSLYSPINKGSTWKYTANAAGSWTVADYTDAEWTDVNTLIPTVFATGTQYFRHAFSGLSGLAAIEVQFNYRYGIIAYINGVEIYRDNMPEGPVTAETTSSNSYSSIAYRGLIRPSDVAEAASSVLAVELHFPVTNYMETIQFNGFLSMMAGISAENKCFVLPQTPTVTGNQFTAPDDAFSWTRDDRAYSRYEGGYLTASYMAYSALGHINGYRLWPYATPDSATHTFSISGSNNVSGPFEEVFATSNSEFTANTWKQWTRATMPGRYSHLRVTVFFSQSNYRELYELQFMVCNIPVPNNIPYTQTKTSFYRNYESVSLVPSMYGFANCEVTPALPAGITWNSETCSLSGVSTETRAQQIYTVTTTVEGVQATGTFTLEFTDCATAMYKVVREYSYAPSNEGFRFYDSSTMEIFYELQSGHNHPANSNWEHLICIAPERFDVVFYHSGNFWSSNSYFNLYYLLPNDEQELVLRGRFDAFENTVSNVYARRPTIGYSQQWHYKFDSVPANWHSSDVSGWSQAARGSFPTATNKIQLFKKTFTVNNLSEVKGYILSIRYKYGCVVYLNGQEAWRNGVIGEVGPAAIADNLYNDIKYRVVTLPGKTMTTATQPTAVNYLQQGVNTIAIALVAIADTQTTVDFDCIVRLMPSEQSESHLWEFDSGTMDQMSGDFKNAFNMDYSSSLTWDSETACTSNFVQFKLADDRREWVSSMHIQKFHGQIGYSAADYKDPTQFKVYGRNKDTEEWTLLKQVTSMYWSLPGQKHRIYFQNNVSYNQFRFEDIFPANHATECIWRVQSLDLYADNLMAELAPLSYGTETIEVFKDIEISEIIPTGEGYGDFTINPPLPEGLTLDAQSGWISGTAKAIAGTVTYTVTANKVTGGTATATITIAVAVCTDGRSLITARFRADSYKNENSWRLYQGRGTEGELLQQVTAFPLSSSYYYVDFCLNDGIYTLEGQDSDGDGWQFNNGYTLTADVGAMELDIRELPSGSRPTKVSSVFSSFFPFQMEYTNWKVSQNGFVDGWNTVAFDDAAWTTMKAADIPTHGGVTTYIRKTFTLTNVADYQVLMKYTGGVACYFNGNLVALINLSEYFDEGTESIEVHDATIDAKFHIILPTAGVVEGLNVVAFEVHRPKGLSSSHPVVFDATGVFGVDDCSVVLDSYSQVVSTEPITGTIANIMDLDPYTSAKLPNVIDTYIRWTVDNRLGSKWNAFNLHLSGDYYSWGFRVYAVMNPEDEGEDPLVAFHQTEIQIKGRERSNFPVPVALAGFRQYKWEVIQPSDYNTDINSMFQTYCKASGAACPAIENYPSVAEGQISPAACPDGYKGYSYRNCVGGVLSEILMDKCTMKIPAMAKYSRNHFEFVRDVAATTGVPSVKNIVTKWYLDENVKLPTGLTLNQQTGEITGMPTEITEMTSYTVFAENESGVTSATITLSVRIGRCQAEGVFPVTEVDQTVIYECSTEGAYVGTQTRTCKLGAVDGEWQKASGICVSIVTIVTLILIALVVIIIVIFIVMRASRKAKAVGGVKGKKNSKTMKVATPKKADKSVKV